MTTIGSGHRRLAAALALLGAPAFAQAPKPAPTPTTPLDAVPGEITPGAKPTAPPRSLSDKLNSSNGVIPPAEVDPAIEKPAPKTQDPNVLPPPGTSGGALAPQAK